MADFDEYEYLDKQLEQSKERENGGGRENGKEERHRDRKEKHSSRDRGDAGHRDRERERRSHRSSDRDRVEERKSSRHGSRGEAPRQAVERPRHRTRTPPPKRERTPPEVRELKERERELRELDRDTRTVFAYNLPLRADERDLFEFFSRAGQVVDVRIIMDRNTRKSKGFAYIEYANREDIINALALTGQVLMNQAVMVKNSEAEKNLAWEASQQQASVMNAVQNAMGAAGGFGDATGPCKLSVGNLHPNIAEGDLKDIFEPFGAIESIQLERDAAGRSQGLGYVSFRSMADATKAIQQLDGLEIAGNRMAVKVAALSAAQTAGMNQMAAAEVTLDDDEDDGGGLKLTSHARAALMSRLAGTSGLVPPGATGANTMPLGAPMMVPQAPKLPGVVFEQGILGPASPIPTQCLLLKNMFDPATETEENWDLDITEDVKEECQKFGPVQHIWVDKNSKGFVYVKFAVQDGAMAAQRALSGRWFAGRQIVADYQFTAVYNNHFKV